MWPETPCKICGKPTIDEGGLCSEECLLRWEATPAPIHEGDPGDEHDPVGPFSSTPYWIDSAGDGPNQEINGRSLQYADPVAIALLDRVAPAFIELIDEYHIGDNMQKVGCHLCALRDEMQDYIDRRKLCQT